MNTVMGIRGKDFVMIAADTCHTRGVVILNDHKSKIHKVSDSVMVSAVGNSGDTSHFVSFIERSLALYKVNHGFSISPKSAAHFTRKNLAEYLRNLVGYKVSLLLGGYDNDDGPLLYYIDCLASSVPVLYGSLGFADTLCITVLERLWHEEITPSEAYEIFKVIIYDFPKRCAANLKMFTVCVFDKDGFREMEPIMLNPPSCS